MDYVLTSSGRLIPVDALQHHGIKGMKWGVRRYQRKDGSLTRLGKKHRAAALKGLEDSKKQAEDRAALMDSYVKTNRKSLHESKLHDKNQGETSWQTRALVDAYKAAGQQYVNSKVHADTYDAYIKAYGSGDIKVGEDYAVTNYRRGIVQLTDSGRAKEVAIIEQVMADAEKRYAKEIKEYG